MYSATPVRPAAQRVTRQRRALVLVALAGVACAGFGAVVPWSLLALTLWALSWPGTRSRLAALPPASLCMALSAVVLGLGAEVFDFSVGGTVAARLALAALLAPPVVLGFVRSPSWHATDAAEWAAALPAMLLVGLAVAVRLLPGWYLTDWLLLGNDSIEHVLYVGKVQQAGGLDYAADAYPTGIHQLIALLVSAGGGRSRSPAGLLAALQITATTTWCIYAVMTVGLGLAAVALSRRIGLAGRAAALAGATAGAVALTGPFFTFSMAFGFVTTVGLGAVLAVIMSELARGKGSSVTVLLVATALTAHVWQLAWPLAVLAALLAVAAGGFARQSMGRAALGGLVTGALSAPALFAVSSQVPVAAISAPGALATLSPVWTAFAAAAALWLSVLALSRAPLRPLALFVLGCFCFALLVGWRSGSLMGYYPRKLLWHAVLLAVPLVCVAAVAGFDQLLERAGRKGLMKHPAPLLTLVLLACLPTPFIAASGGWTRSDGVLAQVRKDAARAESAADVNRGESDRTVISRLRGYYVPSP